MNRIVMPPGENTSAVSRLDNVIDREQNIRKKVARSIAGYGGVMVSIFLMFITVMVITTDVTISLESIEHLSTDFFLLLFCSYASYICCSDSGAKAGKLSTIYKETVKKFNELQQKLIDGKIHFILGDFCKEYIATELKNAKTYYLVSAGVDYDEYIGKYSNLDDTDIEAISGLSTTQKEALMSANAVKPIKLYPEQIIRAGGANSRHSPLRISPEVRRRAIYLFKFFSIVGIALGMSLIALNEVTSSSWTIFVMIIIKLGSVLYNCFSGYKCGYENIVIHSVNYMTEQISLMQQAIIFAAERKDNYVENKHICTNEVRIGSGDSES